MAQQNTKMKIEFEYEGTWITDPYLDETGRFEVNPEEYYGETYLKELNKIK
jgi:hypothetical protein